MNTTPHPAASPRRTLLQRLFGAGLGQNLISVWVTEIGNYLLPGGNRDEGETRSTHGAAMEDVQNA